MKSCIVNLILCLGLSIYMLDANAVVLNHRGTGQVLIYPYYTVNKNQQTYLSVTNNSERAKALQINFLEGRNGRSVLSFNIYIAAYDVWTAALFSLDDEGAGNLLTRDNSCTLPLIKTDTSISLPSLEDGTRYKPFVNFAYSGSNEDAGPDGLTRTREGLVEIFEMGTIVPGSATETAIKQYSADGSHNETPNCTYLAEAWATGGVWDQDPTTDLTNPTGGLSGNAQIINVSEGTIVAYTADALEEFRQDPTDIPRGTTNSVVYHVPAGEAQLTLANVLTDPANSLASASVFMDGQILRLDYDVATQAIDAVSAVFMADTAMNDYVTDPDIGAKSEWIVSMPTRPFYTDEAIVGARASPIAPFPTIYPQSGAESDACYEVKTRVNNREGDGIYGTIGGGFIPPLLPENMCYTVQVMPIVADSGGYSSFLGSSLISTSGYIYSYAEVAGWVNLDLSHDPSEIYDYEYAMRPAAEGTVLNGLPMTGFMATNLVNANVTPGVLANYSFGAPNRTTITVRVEVGDDQ